MRRIFTAALTVAAFAAVPATAQAQVSFGATAAFHDDADFGVGGFVGAPLTALHENVRWMGEFLWFFPGDDSFFGADVDYMEINGNLLWDFVLADNPGLTPFALGGLNVARISASSGGVSHSDTEVGLNLGGGVTFGTGSLRPAVGARIELGGGEGFVIFGSLILGGG